ncbi:hypothetical protein D3C71_1393840 [compost metagenome]
MGKRTTGMVEQFNLAHPRGYHQGGGGGGVAGDVTRGAHLTSQAEQRARCAGIRPETEQQAVLDARQRGRIEHPGLQRAIFLRIDDVICRIARWSREGRAPQRLIGGVMRRRAVLIPEHVRRGDLGKVRQVHTVRGGRRAVLAGGHVEFEARFQRHAVGTAQCLAAAAAQGVALHGGVQHHGIGGHRTDLHAPHDRAQTLRGIVLHEVLAHRKRRRQTPGAQAERLLRRGQHLRQVGLTGSECLPCLWRQ